MTNTKLLVVLCIYSAWLLAACSYKNEESQAVVTALPFHSISLNDLSSFKPIKTKAWSIAGNVWMSRKQVTNHSIQEGNDILINQPSLGKENLLTSFGHEDIDLMLDFMLSKGAATALYFQGRYAVIVSDSWKKDSISASGCGVIKTSAGASAAPSSNACKAPGLWQHLYIRFKAPRFDAYGKKLSNAVFTEVVLNGKQIQQEVQAPEVSNGTINTKESAMGPLMFQSASGVVAFRHIQYKAYNHNQVSLANMQFEVYKGLYKNYDTLKNFQPVRTGRTDSLTWRVGDKKAQLVFKGDINIPTDGDYLFKIRSGGPSWLFINDKEVLDNDSTREYTIPFYSVVNLKKGKHAIKIIYANYDESLMLEYEGPDIPLTALTTPSSERFVKPVPPLEYVVQSEPEYQRGFMQHKDKIRTYTMAVGVPGGLNYSYDLNTYAPLSVWRGRYIDVSNMWEERGESQRAIALGAPVAFGGTPSLIQTNDPATAWPDTVDAELNIYSNRGYSINGLGLPVYQYSYNNIAVEESYTPLLNNDGFKRTISLKPNGSSKDVYFQLASGRFIESLPSGGYAVDDKEYYIEDLTGVDVKSLSIIQSGNGSSRLVVKLPATAVSMAYSIIW